jgi:lipopolysaccharide transport system ATP-binding protein
MSAIIEVENLGKKYVISHQRRGGGETLRDAVTHAAKGTWQRLRHPLSPNRESLDLEEMWALRDVNFEVEPGQRIGIIGRNGAGKSTLLRILSRITHPTTGRVRLRGRVSSLLEVGTGFHPELTGRENVFLNGAILGMTRQEIKKKFDEIVAFAEIEKFLDTPVKHYSSGMYVRLAFAVAAHLEPEILIVDEVLAVGDAQFQKKCLGKMGEVAKEGRTVLFVSHNMAAVQNLCNVACWLNRGRIAGHGNVAKVIADYVQTVSGVEHPELVSRTDRKGNGRLTFVGFSGSRSGQAPGSTTVVHGAPAAFVISYQGTPPLRNVQVSAGFFTALGEGALYLSNDLVGTSFDNLPSAGSFRCSFERFPLLPGTYVVNLYSTVNGILADWVADAARIHVVEGDFFGTGRLAPQGYGAVAVPHRWDFGPAGD